MAESIKIQSFQQVVPMIYAYNTPGISYHDGWTKIGYTEKQSVKGRIAQQTHTADIRYEIAWQDNAMYKDGSGEYFRDTDFHDFLEAEHIKRKDKTEWFHIDGLNSLKLFNRFARRERPSDHAEHRSYELRKEQKEAVEKTKAYFEQGGKEFLWNAKPRFGKTLSSYDLIRQMHCQTVLIVTHRPAISNSWADDFRTFIAWQEPLYFVSDTDALRDNPDILTRDEYMKRLTMDETPHGMVAFISLQDLKGSKYFGGSFDKLKWVSDLSFDLLIVDEAQEGVDTLKTEVAFRYIHRKHTLYLSGTPFKALASEKFTDAQIYNWSYADEQAAKEAWNSDDYNPYEPLPRLFLYTYQLSPMIEDTLQRGLDLTGNGDTVDYAFDLNEFFATNDKGQFIHNEEVKKFLRALTTQEKYPFSTPELRNELSHTLWRLDRIASAKALAKLLQSDEFSDVFGDYEIVLAAGNGKLDEDEEIKKAYDKVKEAIQNNDKTITLSVGQLTVGVTIPEWSAVLMLCNLQSPSAYMQTAFRAQNPYIFTKNQKRMRKENAYIFDFDPARTLIIFDEFANNLSPATAAGKGTGEDRKENIRQLLNFFPVLGEDPAGKMIALDAEKVLTIPRKLKSQEVVRRGFLSNFLFQNIGRIFGAPDVVKDILNKLTPAQEEFRGKESSLPDLSDVPLDENGDVSIPKEQVIGKSRELFGEKIYEETATDIEPALSALSRSAPSGDMDREVTQVKEALKKAVREHIVAPAAADFKVKKRAEEQIARQAERDIERRITEYHTDFVQQKNMAEAELARAQQEAQTPAELTAAEETYRTKIEDITAGFTESVNTYAQEKIRQVPQEVVERLMENEAEAQKRADEDAVRAHLRGFSRTIPSFLMAYGDRDLRLSNFDAYTEPAVFEEVTGITLDDFRLLRDGGDVPDKDGQMVHVEGHFFDEVVFDDAVQEFLNKKEALADYFDDSHEEDIFDYIPPQKTNQIFTPRAVVAQMVDALETENPGCFDDPDATFADLYMKSGLYITEIVKRLFRSEKMKALYPDDGARIRHILRHQVYGMAPTRIIYLIATNYILGFDARLKSETTHFVEADAAEAAKDGTLAELVQKHFG